MARIEELNVGQRVVCRGLAGTLMTVDRPSGQVVVRFDPVAEPAVSSDGVVQVPLGDVTVLASEVSVEEEVKAPSKAAIAAARAEALKAGRAEGLKGQQLEDVQDEAEAELVSRASKVA